MIKVPEIALPIREGEEGLLRAAAKKAKNFAEADRIRAGLAEKGYTVIDTPQGPKVTKG